LLLQVIVRPVNTFPLASRSTAVACVLPPTVSDVLPNVIEIDATGAGGGALTPIEAFAETPSTVPVIVVDPALTPVTMPDDETVATIGLALRQETTRSVTTLPCASTTLAVSCNVPPADN
jgi:hypothetical protein